MEEATVLYCAAADSCLSCVFSAVADPHLLPALPLHARSSSNLINGCSACVLCLQENIPIEEVFEQLKCTRQGLTSDEGAQRVEIFGLNKLEEKKVTTSSMVSSSFGLWFHALY
jgi:hypothetical protein